VKWLAPPIAPTRRPTSGASAFRCARGRSPVARRSRCEPARRRERALEPGLPELLQQAHGADCNVGAVVVGGGRAGVHRPSVRPGRGWGAPSSAPLHLEANVPRVHPLRRRVRTRRGYEIKHEHDAWFLDARPLAFGGPAPVDPRRS
jgi:hypothetical protein